MSASKKKKSALKIGVVDFFSGCGGVSYGFSKIANESATVEIIAGIDNDKHSCSTYRSMLGRPSHELDISTLIEDDNPKLDELIASWRLERFDKVILVGCAPCQGFAAHRKSIRGHDHRRSLFGIFSEIATRISPDAIFMENVPDMFSKKHWEHYQSGRVLLERSGYHVRSQIFNFADFGLPQERFRAVMMAFKEPFPMPRPIFQQYEHRTVRDAIGHLQELASGGASETDSMHIVSKHRPETVEIIKKVPLNGGNRPIGVGPACLDRTRAKHGGYTDVYGRLAWDTPAVTITARCRTPSCGRFTHPQQHRGLSVREAALLQGFPEEFILEGPFDDKYKQIGNAVPPLVATRMGEHMVRVLQGVVVEAGAVINGYENDVTSPVGRGFAVTINGIKRRRKADDEQARGMIREEA
jgi:DNA (cytosine-5)-methyltransferase 1